MMLITALILLILLSAFFSGAETGMMATNRYRLRHLARKSNLHAKRVLKLLERPDRLLGVILIGNTFSNIFASAIATMLAVRWFSEVGVLIVTILLTLVILIFAETAPKTVAALYSQRFAFAVAGPLSLLLKLLYPLVWLVNGVANSLLWLVGVRVGKHKLELLSIDELRSVVNEATGKTSLNYQEMLLRVLDLQQDTVDSAMVPKSEIYGIDLSQSWDTLVKRIIESPHAMLPVYREHIENVQGLLSLREALVLLRNPAAEKSDVLRLVQDVYFIPESALLHQQLLHFQREQRSIGLVVDEYGDIQGLLTLRDVLEEIVGEFSMSAAEIEQLIAPQKDGSVLVDASISVRDLNRLAQWCLPVHGPRTLSGLIIEYLEIIPKTRVAARIGGYPMEVLSVSHNIIKQVRVWPRLYDEKKNTRIHAH